MTYQFHITGKYALSTCVIPHLFTASHAFAEDHLIFSQRLFGSDVCFLAAS